MNWTYSPSCPVLRRAVVWALGVGLSLGMSSCTRGAQALRATGKTYSDHQVVQVYGQLGHRMSLRSLRFVKVYAADGEGNALETKISTLPDSKVGPIANIVVSTPAPQGREITVDARMEYRRKPFDLRAVFIRERKRRGFRRFWEAKDVVLRDAE